MGIIYNTSLSRRHLPLPRSLRPLLAQILLHRRHRPPGTRLTGPDQRNDRLLLRPVLDTQSGAEQALRGDDLAARIGEFHGNTTDCGDGVGECFLWPG